MDAATNPRAAVSIAAPKSRQQLSVLCSSSSTRTVETTADRPSKWWPREVRHPVTGAFFDEVSVWQFIKAAIDCGTVIKTLRLEGPLDLTSYVIVLQGHAGQRIYVKLEIGKTKVFGKSFHICENGRIFN